jgi:hypothetical protein
VQHPQDLNSVNDLENELQGLGAISSPVLRRLFFLIRIIGCLIMVANLVTEMTYLFRNKFSTVMYFSLYTIIGGLKFLIPIVIILVNFKRFVIGKLPRAFTYDLEMNRREVLGRAYLKAGFMLYTAIPITYLTGVYRLLGAKNFSKEIGLGFGLDVFFSLALFFLQGLNNATLTNSSVEKQLIASGSF